MRPRSIAFALLLIIGCKPQATATATAKSDAAQASDHDSSDSVQPSQGAVTTVRPVGTWDAAVVKTPPGAVPCSFGPNILALPPADGRCDQAACKAAKGTCVWGGFGCVEVCALLTTDVGKICSDSSECQGSCLADEKVPKGTQTKGTCSPTMIGRGCSNPIVKGVASGHICAD